MKREKKCVVIVDWSGGWNENGEREHLPLDWRALRGVSAIRRLRRLLSGRRWTPIGSSGYLLLVTSWRVFRRQGNEKKNFCCHLLDFILGFDWIALVLCIILVLYTVSAWFLAYKLWRNPAIWYLLFIGSGTIQNIGPVRCDYEGELTILRSVHIWKLYLINQFTFDDFFCISYLISGKWYYTLP